MKKLFALLLAIVSFIGMAFAAVNVNTATQKELESLRGIGPVRAKAIIAYREKNGPFATLEDVDKVPGIGKGTLSKMKDDVIFAGPTTSLGPDAKTSTAAEPKKTAAAEKTTTKTETKPEPRATTATEKPARTAAAEKTTAAEKSSKTAPAEKPAKTAAADKPAAKSEPVDINHASQKELEALPGVGEARAKAIIKGRPYKGKDDLVAKKVVSESLYAEIKDHIVARQK